MSSPLKSISLSFSAGCLGGLANSITLWLFGHFHLASKIGVKPAPKLTAQWLHPRIVWGGIWGLLLILPVFSDSMLLRSMVLSLGPTLVQLLYIFPERMHKGLMGFKLGTFTPLCVIFFNWIWAITALFWLKITTNE